MHRRKRILTLFYKGIRSGFAWGSSLFFYICKPNVARVRGNNWRQCPAENIGAAMKQSDWSILVVGRLTSVHIKPETFLEKTRTLFTSDHGFKHVSCLVVYCTLQPKFNRNRPIFELNIWFHSSPNFGSFGHSPRLRMSAILNVFHLIMIETTRWVFFSYAQKRHVSIIIRATHRLM